MLVDETMLIQPRRIVYPTSWVGHIPFASWLIAKQQPTLIVELGTHTGNSYLAFCQAVQENGLRTKCYAVDTCKGDEYTEYYDDTVFNGLSEYHYRNYETFSQLLRLPFDDALSFFNNGSIDLLHINEPHGYEAIKHAFETWLPKMSRRGIILFHNINVREPKLGAWKLWGDLSARYANFHFEQSHGLGALFVGTDISEEIQELLQVYQADTTVVKKLFTYLGQRLSQQYQISNLNLAATEHEIQIANLNQTLADREFQLTTVKQDLTNRNVRIANLKKVLAKRAVDIANLNQCQDERALRLANLNQSLAERDLKLTNVYQNLNAIRSSPSWVVTRPLRELKNSLKSILPLRQSKISNNVQQSLTEKFLPSPPNNGHTNANGIGIANESEIGNGNRKSHVLETKPNERIVDQRINTDKVAASFYRKAVEAKGLKSIGISMIKNEETIIECSIRHNLNFLDGMVIINNNSSDSSADILRSLILEGLPICVIDDSILGYLQCEKLSTLFTRVCSAFFVDFVIPLDADELIQADSKESFLDSLSAIPSPGIGFWPWVTYIPHPAAAKNGLLPHQFQFRRKVESPQYFKVIIRTGTEFPSDIIITQGSHDAWSTSHQLEKVLLKKVNLAHFPVRNKTQISCNALLGWLANLAKDKNIALLGFSYQKQAVYQKLLLNAELDDLDLTTIALSYCQNKKFGHWKEHVVPAVPRVLSSASVYNSTTSSSVLATVAKAWERSIVFEPETICPEDLKKWSVEPTSNDNGDNGIFDPDWHIKNLYVDIQPFKYLYDRLTPDSVLDVGCGAGQYLHLLKKFGANIVLGQDGFIPEVSFLEEHDYLVHDLTKPLFIDQSFDLVMCLEVAEHMPPGSESLLVQTLENHAKDHILFSAAEPGQPGRDHINCRPFEFWAEIFESRGWAPLLFETLSFRAISSLSWLRRNPILLTKRPMDEEVKKQAWAKLIDISKIPFQWYHQNPCIITEPLQYAVPSSYYTLPDRQVCVSTLSKLTKATEQCLR